MTNRERFKLLHGPYSQGPGLHRWPGRPASKKQGAPPAAPAATWEFPCPREGPG